MAVVKTTALVVVVFVLRVVRVFVHLILVELDHAEVVMLESVASATARNVVIAARAEKANVRILNDD